MKGGKIRTVVKTLLITLFSIGYATAASNDNGLTPMQLRLAYAGATGVYVSWNTKSQLDQPTVHWGTSPDQLIHSTSSDVSITYQTSSTYNNHVKIEGLCPDTQYYYLPEHGEGSQPYSFRTSREAGDHTPFVAAVVVDLGAMGSYGLTTHTGEGAGGALEPGERNTIQALRSTQHEWDFLWHGG